MEQEATLKRSIGLKALVCYGIGTMVGGGFYALLGKVAGDAGHLAPLALAASGLLALLNVFAFAELASRFPVSAGEVRYVREGLDSRGLASLTGVLVICAGVVSAAALSTATAGFLRDVVPIDTTLGTIGVLLVLGAVAAWGIGQSVALVVVITIIEVGALALAVALNIDRLPTDIPQRVSDAFQGGALDWIGVFSGAFLGVYAFIGFEDMVNLAEEAKKPRRNVPLALLLSVGITTVIYVVVSGVAVATVDPQRLSESRTPIAELMDGTGAAGRTGMVVVSILTGVNGALVQLIMASRVMYGMAKQGQAPGFLGHVHPRTRTPLRATALLTAVILVLALWLPLTHLARLTSAIVLLLFALMNAALWRLKGKDPDPHGAGPRYPRVLLAIAFFASISVVAAQAWLTFSES